MIGKLSLLLLVAFAATKATRRHDFIEDNFGDMTSSKIYNGSETEPNEFPWQVWLQMYNGGIFASSCGGSLISADWVLTAAHCINGVDSGTGLINITMGAHDKLDTSEPTQVKVTVTNNGQNVIVHEDYSTQTLANDIGLIKMDVPVTFTSAISAVELPSEDGIWVQYGDTAVATGWGLVNPGSTSDVLMSAELLVIDIDSCKATYQLAANNNTICTAGVYKGICSGDSGGPLNSIPKGIVYGITSYGHVDGCDSRNPNGFSRVRYFLDWIEAKSGVTPP